MRSYILLVFCIGSLSGVLGHKATTTRYSGSEGSCGGCNVNQFRNVAGWAAVATPQSMQEPYECGGCPTCACGTGVLAHNSGKVAAGCGMCFSATSTGRDPWGGSQPRVSFFMAVVDSCPYNDNKEWCPKNPGNTNNYGYEYHFDIVEGDVNKLGLGDNPIIDFNPIECPGDIVRVMNQNCCGIWWHDQGCPRRSQSGITFGNCNAQQFGCG